jgi:hypothetical protein
VPSARILGQPLPDSVKGIYLRIGRAAPVDLPVTANQICGPTVAVSRAASRPGGVPNALRYSRLNWDGLS